MSQICRHKLRNVIFHKFLDGIRHLGQALVTPIIIPLDDFYSRSRFRLSFKLFGRVWLRAASIWLLIDSRIGRALCCRSRSRSVTVRFRSRACASMAKSSSPVRKSEPLLSLLRQTWAADIGLWARVVNAWGFTKRQQPPCLYWRPVQ